MQIFKNKISYLFENGFRYAAMKILGRVPMIKSNLALLARLSSNSAYQKEVFSEHFLCKAAVEKVINELDENGYSRELFCREKTIGALRTLSLEMPLYAYQESANKFYLRDKDNFEKTFSREILIAHYANLTDSRLFRELENDPLLISIARGYLGKRAKCIASQMWWTFPADVSADIRSKAAHFYHRDLDAFQFIKFFIYVSDVNKNDGGHFFVSKSHKPHLLHSLRERFRISRVSDGQISEWYGEDSEIEMTGCAGTTIVEDTFGFHKGQSPNTNARLMACLVFANQDYGVQRFNV